MPVSDALVISDYDPQWPRGFEELRERVADALGKTVDRIEHVGSTSVPGMCAKPVIDLDVLLRADHDLPVAIERLARIGYEYQGNRGIPGREAFRTTDAAPAAHHLYVCPPRSAEFARHIALRDYLRSHPDDARAYSALKKSLYPQFRDDRYGYQNAKDAFVADLVRRACKFYGIEGRIMSTSVMRIGAIGVDSSHLPEFTKRIKALHDAGKTRCRVTHVFDPGAHDLPNAPKWLADTTRDYGVQQVASMDELLKSVDCVMVLSVNGNKHLAQALPSLERGLPTYIDKPLTCDLDEAKQLLSAARKSNARCYSASSLRFAPEVEAVRKMSSDLGKLAAIDAFGPGELHQLMAGLFYYGVHTIEMVDAIWGPGVKRVSAIHLSDRDLVDLDYHDGRYARLRLERKGSYDFGATVHGEKKLHQFKVDFGPVYMRLIEGMTRFFEAGPAPADLRDVVENIAVMQAGNESMRRDGSWVEIERID